MQVWLGQVQIMLDHKLRDESDIVHCSLVQHYCKIFKVSTFTVLSIFCPVVHHTICFHPQFRP